MRSHFQKFMEKFGDVLVTIGHAIKDISIWIFEILRVVLIFIFSLLWKMIVWCFNVIKPLFIFLGMIFGQAFKGIWIILSLPLWPFKKLFSWIHSKVVKVPVVAKISKKFEKPKGQPLFEALYELKDEILFMDVFNILLNSVIGFLLGLVVILIINIGWEFALIPGTVVAGYYFIQYYHQKDLLVVEENVPELRESLRTAADNLNRNNEITNDLKSDVVKQMKGVKSTYFLDLEDVAIRMFSISIIVFIIVILSFLNISFDFHLDSEFMQSPAQFVKERLFSQDAGPNATMDFKQGNDADILGNRTKLIELNGEILKVQLNPLQSELNFDDVQDAEKGNFNPPVYPKEIYTSYDSSYSEQIAKKNQAVVKTYFEEISK
jgi:hypothetical protein